MELSLGKRLFFGGLIVSLGVTAALAIGILLFSEFDETTGKILMTTALVAAFSVVSLPAGVLLDQRRYAWLAWCVIALSAGAFVVSMVLIWRNWDDEGGEPVWQTLAVLASFAVAGSQIAMSASRRRPDASGALETLFFGSVALALVGATMISIGAVEEVDSDGYWRILGAVVVADLFLVIVQPVARRMSRPPGVRTTFAFEIALDRAPGDLPAGYTAEGTRVACSVAAAGFADAVAEAIRVLERGGVTVVRVERNREA